MGLKTFFMAVRRCNVLFCSVRKSSVLVLSRQNRFNQSCLHNLKFRNLNRKYCTEVIYSSESEEIEEGDDFFDENELGSALVPLREVLSPNRNDPLIAELNNCSSVQGVFDFINKNESAMNETHISQAVIILWDLQKCYYKHNFFYQECDINRLVKSNDLLRNYIVKVKTHDDFQKLLSLIEANYKTFTMDALTCCLIYLNRMGVDIGHPLMQKMILRCENQIRELGMDFPLTALSRFCVAIYQENDNIWSLLTLKDSLPIILTHLDNCETAQDLKLITICLNKMNSLITPEVLDGYRSVIEKLIEEEKLTSVDQRTILKCLAFLSKPQWCNNNTKLVRKLFYILRKQVHRLTNRELIMLFKIFQKHKEPADMLDEIQESAANRFSNSNYENNLEMSLDLLSCIVSFSSPLQRPKFEENVRQYLQNNLTSNSLTSLYKILYHIKSTDVKLCNTFWDKTLSIIKREDGDQKLNELLNLCHKYMHFNRDSFYRYYKFERTVIELLLYELEFGLSGLIPNKFSRIVAFILAYTTNLSTLETITERLKELQHNLSVIDCLNLSKGLQIANAQNSKKIHFLLPFYNQISLICDSRIEKSIHNDNFDLGLLFRSYCNINVENLDKTLSFFKENDISSNVIKDLCFNLQNSSALLPDLLEILIGYSLENSKSLLGTTVDKLLNLCYYLGYSMNNLDEFCDLCSTLIVRDRERFSGLAFIQTALALCFFNKLPEFLVKHIFSVDFLEKLDEELSHCYAKATYPTRVRNHIMQLNRAVCLDYIECDVPWFHQKYVEQIQNKHQPKTHFQQKVHATIIDVIKDDSIISENVFTPYGYHLDFEINLSKEDSKRTLAVNILPSRAYTLITKNLKGYYQLKKKHLEILGYEVIYENQNDWKELYTQEHCTNYLYNKILPKVP